MKVKTGIGQDSHRFDFDNKEKDLVLGGVIIPDSPPLKGNSDADVILHAVTNAVSGITGINILGKIADDLCLKQGISDSSVFLKEALKHLNDYSITHVSISVECLKPKLSPHIDKIKKSISDILSLTTDDIGLTATTGEGLTEFGRGNGIQVFSVVTAISD
ncbi:MAG: 2-C-methyl-D-erythritol 2,4-cyclodiphosphate synthase [Candidatus Aureabacteria bacterium]|nr:2-C-methyl-D-erythritol 2,4-cyclodiphosphate synthase [Candidatus Auribacterota bacterium]